MARFIRAALTAAVLTAIALRLRRPPNPIPRTPIPHAPTRRTTDPHATDPHATWSRTVIPSTADSRTPIPRTAIPRTPSPLPDDPRASIPARVVSTPGGTTPPIDGTRERRNPGVTVAPRPVGGEAKGWGRVVGRMLLAGVALAVTVASAFVVANASAGGPDRSASGTATAATSTAGQAVTDAAAQAAVSAVTPMPTVGSTPGPTGCVDVGIPVVVRPLDPRVRRAVARQWRRIERWLRAHAPRTYATLGARGRAGTVAIAESQMGLHLPDDLRASLLRHNGVRGEAAFAFAGDQVRSIREIRDQWRATCAGPTMQGGPSHHAMLRATADAIEQGTPLNGFRPTPEAGRLTWQPTP